MKRPTRHEKAGRILLLASLISLFLFPLFPSDATVPASPWGSLVQKNRSYVVLAWNNLGMHCYNPTFKHLAILPPYNTLWAQVIKAGDLPQQVTEGITVEYRFPGNTYSAGKTDFWTYAKQLFQPLFPDAFPLPDNVGLTGKGLSGSMDLVHDSALGDHFVAEGIPLTEYYDKGPKKPSPYQLAEITVKDTRGNILAQTVAVAPVSSELTCSNCHADDGDASMKYAENPLPGLPPFSPTGDVDTNILALHDYLNGKYKAEDGLMSSQPVLCAGCHSENALGAPGVDGVSSLSFAMHNHHNKDVAPDITPNTTVGCYNCHPGPKTRCLRDTMSQNFAINCTSCHGNMADVASSMAGTSIDPEHRPWVKEPREPWANEPRCDAAVCHGPGYALDQDLYRNSRGHGGTYCAGCHDSPHAIAPSREVNDSLKFLLLQGRPDTLRKCTVCHATQPDQMFHHQWPPAL